MNGKKILVEDNTGTSKNEYWDILKTEDAVLSALEEYIRLNDELEDDIDNQLVKK